MELELMATTLTPLAWYSFARAVMPSVVESRGRQLSLWCDTRHHLDQRAACACLPLSSTTYLQWLARNLQRTKSAQVVSNTRPCPTNIQSQSATHMTRVAGAPAANSLSFSLLPVMGCDGRVAAHELQKKLDGGRLHLTFSRLAQVVALPAGAQNPAP